MKSNFIKIITVILCFSIFLTACSCSGKPQETEYTFPTPTETTTTENTTIETQTKETSSETSETTTEEVKTHQYAVSSSNDYVTSVGMTVLESGGNAVDAAIAMGYALGVVEPFASGLGGSGGMLVYDSVNDKAVFYDYRACAGSYFGSDLVSVPGFVSGMEKAHEDYGTISMADLINPALYYAESGFKVSKVMASQVYAYSYLTSQIPAYLNENGNVVGTDQIMYQPDLAQTLRAIQENGSDVFYNGYIASDIVSRTSLYASDLSSYKTYVNDALSVNYNGYKIYGANAPLSGLMLLQMLAMSEKIGMVDPSEDIYTHLSQLSEIASIAQNERFRLVSDTTFTDYDYQSFLSDAYISNLVGMEPSENTNETEKIETTSFSVADSNGLFVSVTNTLSDLFGSGIYVDGFWMNDSNSNFSSTGINTFEPGKRSRTYTVPVIVTDGNGMAFAIGTPGGDKIPGIMFFMLENILKYNVPYQDAVNKFRYLYANGSLFIECDEYGNSTTGAYGYNGNGIYIETGFMWGSVSLAGYSPEDGAFAAFDYRRGSTYAGVKND